MKKLLIILLACTLQATAQTTVPAMKQKIQDSINAKTTIGSISPQNVGNRMKELADLANTLANAANANFIQKTDTSRSGIVTTYWYMDSTLKKTVAKQGGNAYGATMVVGTTDNNHVDFYANNGRVMRLFSTGQVRVGSGTTTPTEKMYIEGSARADNLIQIDGTAPTLKFIGTTTNTGTKGIEFWNNNLTAWVRSVPGGTNNSGNLELGAWGQNVITVSGSNVTPTSINLLYPVNCDTWNGVGTNTGDAIFSFNGAEKSVRLYTRRLGSNGKASFGICINTAANNQDAAITDAVLWIPGGTGANARNVSFNNGNVDMGATVGVNGTTKFMSKTTWDATNTAAGTTGAQTINKPSGTVNIAAGGSSVTVTNSLVTTASIIYTTVRSNDATAYVKNVVPAAGSFTINLGAATTAETSIGFLVIN